MHKAIVACALLVRNNFTNRAEAMIQNSSMSIRSNQLTLCSKDELSW